MAADLGQPPRRRRPADRSPTGLTAYTGVRLGAGGLTFLPVSLCLWLARIAGRLAYHLDGRHHAIATENLHHAYGDSLTPEERERIILGAFVNLTQIVVEFHHATRLARKGRALEVVALGTTAETFKARNKEMGVVFVSCHLGNWELLPIGLKRIGITGYAVAQPRPNPRVDRYLKRLRELFGQRILDNKDSFRNLVRLLRAGKNIGLIVDQNDRKSSLLVDFFGRQATVSRGPALLARRVGCPIVPFFIRRVPGVNRHVMSIKEPIQAIKTGDVEADLQQMTQAYTRVFEEMIRKTPEQWLWLHRYWRVRPPEKKEADHREAL